MIAKSGEVCLIAASVVRRSAASAQTLMSGERLMLSDSPKRMTG